RLCCVFGLQSLTLTCTLSLPDALPIPIGGLVALGGVGGIALGFAAQSLVANLVGGLTIYASRPFNVGEWIILPGTEIMGEVQEIDRKSTRLNSSHVKISYAVFCLKQKT